MQYKIAVFDVDLTLRGPEQKYISQQTKDAINKMKELGVKTVIASGRPQAFLNPEYLEGLEADYYISVNGACVADAKGNIIASSFLKEEHIDRLLTLYETDNASVDFVFFEGHYVYTRYKMLSDYFLRESGQADKMFNGEDRTRHLKGLPFGAFVYVNDEAMARFISNNPDLEATAYKSMAYDIFLADSGKEVGIKALLDYLKLDWDSVVAFGDGYNDIGMLKCAGMGVAVGNAHAEVKAVADMVADNYDDEGVAKAIAAIFGI